MSQKQRDRLYKSIMDPDGDPFDQAFIILSKAKKDIKVWGPEATVLSRSILREWRKSTGPILDDLKIELNVGSAKEVDKLRTQKILKRLEKVVGVLGEIVRPKVRVMASVLLKKAIQSTKVEKGGPGSGHFGHEGRPGEVGGSASSEGGGEKETVYHGTSADKMYEILFEGVQPQESHNWDASFYEEERRGGVIYVVAGEGGFKLAAAFAAKAEEMKGKPAVVIEAKVPKDYYDKNGKRDARVGRIGGSGVAVTLPEVKPEWITNVYDTEGNVATKTIDSLRLERFQKKAEEDVTVYIPLSLEVLKKIVKKSREKK